MEFIPITNQLDEPDSSQTAGGQTSSLSSKLNNIRLSNSKSKMSPPETNGGSTSKVPIKLETKFNALSPSPTKSVSKAIDIPSSSAPKSNGSTPFKQKYRRELQNDQTFGTSVDDSAMVEDFDFEKNLALFDKQAIWKKLNGNQKPDIVRQAVTPGFQNGNGTRKYRHNENILVAEPLKLRQIEVNSSTQKEYVTDVGLLIPSISVLVRKLIQSTAELHGLTWARQCDTMARTVAEMAINLIGGARRLIPTNQHQWPKIAVLCDQGVFEKHSEMGLAIGRFLASHGLKTVVYVKEIKDSDNIELNLYRATGNLVTGITAENLPSSDLVILSSSSPCLDEALVKWINANRSPVMAVDPPTTGYPYVCIKCSILPILPLEDIVGVACGNLYLANLGIPDQYYREAGVKYKSPFGHKSLIPLYNVD